MIVQPTWYDTPIHIDFPVEEERIKHSPLGNEMSVTFQFCGDEYYVIIPTHMWNRTASTIPAVQVGEWGDKVLVSFPATSLGTYTLEIPKSSLQLITE